MRIVLPGLRGRLGGGTGAGPTVSGRTARDWPHLMQNRAASSFGLPQLGQCICFTFPFLDMRELADCWTHSLCGWRQRDLARGMGIRPPGPSTGPFKPSLAMCRLPASGAQPKVRVRPPIAPTCAKTHPPLSATGRYRRKGRCTVPQYGLYPSSAKMNHAVAPTCSRL